MRTPVGSLRTQHGTLMTGAAMATKQRSNNEGKYPALSVRQPWATMIICGIKDVEFRSWNMKYRGPLLIHASATATMDHLLQMYFQVGSSEELIRSLPLGAYVGIVDVVDVDEWPGEDGETDQYGIRLENPRMFDDEIKAKGAAGIFYPTDEDWSVLKKVIGVYRDVETSS